MSYGDIVVNGTTFSDRNNGLYVNSNVAFGSPSDNLKIRANSNLKTPSVAIQRTKQVDYTPPGQSVRRISANVQVIISVPPAGFPVSDVDEMLEDISSFVTSLTLSEMLQGKS